MRERKVVYGLPKNDMMSNSVMSMQHPLGANTLHTPVSQDATAPGFGDQWIGATSQNNFFDDDEW